MQKLSAAIAGVLAILGSPVFAQAEETDPGLEMAILPRTMQVTLLNEGGKYVAIDLKHIEKGEACRLDEKAMLVRVGPGSKPGTTLVRYAGAQTSSGGCPFLTLFELSDSDYADGRAAFVRLKEEAARRVEELKKNLGEKWNELTGNRT